MCGCNKPRQTWTVVDGSNQPILDANSQPIVRSTSQGARLAAAKTKVPGAHGVKASPTT